MNTHITMDGSDVHDRGNLPLSSSIVPENAKKAFKSRLKRSEMRASKQAHVALGALLKELDHWGKYDRGTKERTLVKIVLSEGTI